MIVKLLSYNIRFGGRGRERELAEVIRAVAPDIVVFQEATDPVLISRLAGLQNFLTGRRDASIPSVSLVASKSLIMNGITLQAPNIPFWR